MCVGRREKNVYYCVFDGWRVSSVSRENRISALNNAKSKFNMLQTGIRTYVALKWIFDNSGLIHSTVHFENRKYF